jgi:hypothetical protein
MKMHLVHFPKYIDSTEKNKAPTRNRKDSKHDKRSETRYEFKRCRVELHVSECFEKYHTFEDCCFFFLHLKFLIRIS